VSQHHSTIAIRPFIWLWRLSWLPNGLRISRRRGARHTKALKCLRSRARSGRLHPTITVGCDFPALTGTWDDAQLSILQQSVDVFDYYTTKIVECDAQLERHYQAMESRGEPNAALPDLPPAKGESKSKNAMTFNARAQLACVIGVDLVAVMGLSAITVQTIISEIGTDMERFPTVKHFCSWLGLAPHNDISGGKVLRSGTMKVHSRANQAFRQAAHSVTRAHSSIGA
jgi:transposase